ncbi:MAG TPA: DICT sensory domain-containing protein [Gaiellaceae bacterium]|nr:DICT sensory domain-containing protein [Gaiellaceae bacterium]
MLTIGQVARRAGVSVPTLRMWEGRHGFPLPSRLDSGHRRYRERDCQSVLEVVRLRESGFSLESAIARAVQATETLTTSLFAGLRSRVRELSPLIVPKRSLIAISRAVEDECAVRAEPGVLVGSFQRERFYRDSEPRWRELARTSAAALVFADFERFREPADAPAEIPLDWTSPLQREWAIVWDSPGFGVCLAAWERPGQEGLADGRRVFEAIWTVEPRLVREATMIALGIASGPAPDLVGRAKAQFEEPRPPGAETLRAATSLTNRIVSYLA